MVELKLIKNNKKSNNEKYWRMQHDKLLAQMSVWAGRLIDIGKCPPNIMSQDTADLYAESGMRILDILKTLKQEQKYELKRIR